MKPLRILAAAALAAGASPAVQGATIVHLYSTDVRNQTIYQSPFDVQYGRTLLVTPFDTSLGTLTAVRFVNSAQAGVVLQLGTTSTCALGQCILHPSSGTAIVRLGSDLDTGPQTLWADLDLATMAVHHTGPTVLSQTLSISSDREYTDESTLSQFNVGSPAILLSHDLSLDGLFFGAYVPVASRVTSNAFFSTQVIYDYTPLVEGPGPGGPGPVPEPSTWAMMILGFGVIGSALRRRQRTTAQRAYS